ncbi:MAG: hypothetical protein FWE37_06045 [Spirochaetaceae bacterium]|nr:hypothetical protein [Spirochaetaceae bacterium]
MNRIENLEVVSLYANYTPTEIEQVEKTFHDGAPFKAIWFKKEQKLQIVMTIPNFGKTIKLEKYTTCQEYILIVDFIKVTNLWLEGNTGEVGFIIKDGNYIVENNKLLETLNSYTEKSFNNPFKELEKTTDYLKINLINATWIMEADIKEELDRLSICFWASAGVPFGITAEKMVYVSSFENNYQKN